VTLQPQTQLQHYLGQQTLSEIADIEYIQKKLLTALRVPKAFLGFEEVVGDGKNLSLQDIRFARTINRIQKSMIAELNKIAIVHLFLLGFEDELQNFTLGLSNPSTQADLLKIDVWKEKVLLYKDLVSDPGNGIQATSSTWAKNIFLVGQMKKLNWIYNNKELKERLVKNLKRLLRLLLKQVYLIILINYMGNPQEVLQPRQLRELKENHQKVVLSLHHQQ
jgi:hypothetical protein